MNGPSRAVVRTSAEWCKRLTVQQLLLYVGTYTHGDSEGIYACHFDPITRTLSEPRLHARLAQPSFLALSPDVRTLYATIETSETDGKPGGSVACFTIAQSSGTLTPLNTERTHGGSPCHISADESGSAVVVANYMGGSLSVFPVRTDGSLAPLCAQVQHTGSSVNAERQEAPHPHSTLLDSHQRVYCADLGIDRIVLYQLNPKKATLTPLGLPPMALSPGDGPRHLAFHPNHKFAYVINELSNSVAAYAYRGGSGELTHLQTVSTLPASFAGASTAAELHVHPSGQFLYGSNRGHDSLVVCRIDESGRLTVIGHQPTFGKTPRHFAIDPSGRTLIVANQDSHEILCFDVDPGSGQLSKRGSPVRVPNPVCLLFCPLP